MRHHRRKGDWDTVPDSTGKLRRIYEPMGAGLDNFNDLEYLIVERDLRPLSLSTQGMLGRLMNIHKIRALGTSASIQLELAGRKTNCSIHRFLLLLQMDLI